MFVGKGRQAINIWSAIGISETMMTTFLVFLSKLDSKKSEYIMGAHVNPSTLTVFAIIYISYKLLILCANPLMDEW